LKTTTQNIKPILRIKYFQQFTKPLIIALLLITGFTFKANVQFKFTVTNNTSCNWTIQAKDNFNNDIGFSFTASPGNSIYDNTGGTNIAYFIVSLPGCTLLTFGSAGVFGFSSQTTTCISSSTACYNKTIDCGANNNPDFCFGPYMYGRIDIT